MRSGDLRRRVLIQLRGVSQDTFGQQVTSWSDYMTSVPADIQALTGRELLAAQAVNAEVTHQITLRYSQSLADPLRVASMRVIYINGGATRYFNVGSCINVDERNKQIDLLVTEGLNPG